jgi:SAM-dependent MidA family methyltransferase
MFPDLPSPDPAALAHSSKLIALIRERIESAGGWISFADYMDLALYAPGLGYYSAGARKLGAEGDFVTAPEISPLFSRCVGAQCMEVLTGLDGGSILELGAGSGVMAVEILLELDDRQGLPDEYLILEPSADLRERQQSIIKTRCAHLLSRVRWLDSRPESFGGVILANEVADALPFTRFRIGSRGAEELGVGLAEAGFAAAALPARAPLGALVESLLREAQLPVGYTSEFSNRLPAWIEGFAGWLTVGTMLLFDYGFSRREYYSSDRGSGTLRCYYRHRAHDDPFLWPGLQDITAWVDFTLLAESARSAGFEVAGYTTQAQFLMAAGLDARVAALVNERGEPDARAQAEQAHALRQLLLPGEMGETVKVMALTLGDAPVPSGMAGRDMRTSL